MSRPVALLFGSKTPSHSRSVSGKQPSPGRNVWPSSKERNVLLHWRVWASAANTSRDPGRLGSEGLLWAITISVSPPPFWQFDLLGHPTRCHWMPLSLDFQNQEDWVVLPPGPLT